jgi:hypothetical protein
LFSSLLVAGAGCLDAPDEPAVDQTASQAEAVTVVQPPTDINIIPRPV